MAVHPTVEEDAALFVAMRDNGYHVAVEGVDATKVGNTGDDELGIAAANGDRWVEQTGHESKIVSVPEGRTAIRQAESQSDPSTVDGWRSSARTMVERAFGDAL